MGLEGNDSIIFAQILVNETVAGMNKYLVREKTSRLLLKFERTRVLFSSYRTCRGPAGDLSSCISNEVERMGIIVLHTRLEWLPAYRTWQQPNQQVISMRNVVPPEDHVFDRPSSFGVTQTA